MGDENNSKSNNNEANVFIVSPYQYINIYMTAKNEILVVNKVFANLTAMFKALFFVCFEKLKKLSYHVLITGAFQILFNSMNVRTFKYKYFVICFVYK